jgi:hypothetical protein
VGGVQQLPILFLPPDDGFIAVGAIAEIPGRMGHFPGVVALSGDGPPTVVNLQQLRVMSAAAGYLAHGQALRNLELFRGGTQHKDGNGS